MKIRYLTLFLTAAGAVFALGGAGCSTDGSSADPNVQARLRNQLPSACTADQIKACPALDATQCPGGQEPVIDYSADCCPHFTCQPVCSSAQQGTCPMTPAPACPAGTKLWIGTAVEDCCPAYRCEPDGMTCDPTRHDGVACTLALPYCGPNVMPVVVGQTADCCPVYQCPCTKTVDASGAMVDPRSCGCTTPNCQAGEEVVCAGQDVCGGPCTCQPARGKCTTDAQCASDSRCDLSACRLPPMAASATAPTCDTAKCGPQLGIASRMCADGTFAGPTGRCLLNADGSCGWEIATCPTDCYGVCVPNIQTGCKVDTDCPTGQMCAVSCSGWGCGPAGTTTSGGTGSTGTGTPPPDPTTGTGGTGCACPTTDPSCMCDANGNCSGQTCTGQCVPAKPICDPSKPVACPLIAIACPDGATPISDGIDPMTCCPAYHCPMCVRSTPATTGNSAGTGTACAVPTCPCAKQTGTDPTTCCPVYECPIFLPGTTCPI
jgi:hypothetical protein